MSRRIPLSQGRYALVDDADYDWLSQWKWSFVMTAPALERGYAQRKVYTKPIQSIYMHRLILGAKPGEVVDHIDGDRLNNTRQNLRLATPQGNQRNGPKRGHHKGKPTSSVYKGVGKRTLKHGAVAWYASLYIGGERLHLGTFDNEISAALAYDEAAKRHFGEFARLNLPDRAAS